MNLSAIKLQLPRLKQLQFQLPNGTFVPKHFHITEVGVIEKTFIDCGGKVRSEKAISLQLWEDTDFDHRLAPKKLLDIIEISERILKIENLEVVIEYQSDTIGKYGLEFNGKHFLLTKKLTNCLDEDKCGIPQKKQKLKLSEIK